MSGYDTKVYMPPSQKVLREEEGFLEIGAPIQGRLLLGAGFAAVGIICFVRHPSGYLGIPGGFAIAGDALFVIIGLAIMLVRSCVRVLWDTPPTIQFAKLIGPFIIRRAEWRADQVESVRLEAVVEDDSKPNTTYVGGPPWHWEFASVLRLKSGAKRELTRSSDLAHERQICRKVAEHLRVPAKERLPKGVVDEIDRLRASRRWKIVALVIWGCIIFGVIFLMNR